MIDAVARVCLICACLLGAAGVGVASDPSVKLADPDNPVHRVGDSGLWCAIDNVSDWTGAYLCFPQAHRGGGRWVDLLETDDEGRVQPPFKSGWLLPNSIDSVLITDDWLFHFQYPEVFRVKCAFIEEQIVLAMHPIDEPLTEDKLARILYKQHSLNELFGLAFFRVSQEVRIPHGG